MIHDLTCVQREWDERGTFLDSDYDPDGADLDGAAEQDQERFTPGRQEPPQAQADGGTSRKAGGGTRAEGEGADTVESCIRAATGRDGRGGSQTPQTEACPRNCGKPSEDRSCPPTRVWCWRSPSILERVAGEMLVQALWAGCIQQLKFKRNYTKALSDDPFASAGVVGDPIALLGPKIKAGNFLVKVQQARQKQEDAARKREPSDGERSAFSDPRSAAGSGVGVPALVGDRAGKPPEGGTPTEEMSRCPALLAEEPIGVGQNGGVEQSANEEKKMGEKKIARVEQKGGVERSAEPTPNDPLRNLTPDRTKIVWA